MTDSLNLPGKVSLDTSDAEQALGRVGQAAGSMAQGVVKAGKDAGAAVAGVGDGSGDAAQKVDRATSSMIASIQRATAATQAGSKSNAAYFEAIANQRGLDGSVLAPYIAALKQAEQATTNAGNATNLTTQQMQGLVHSARGFFDMVETGANPMRAFAVEGAKLSGTFGGAGAAMNGVKTAISGLLTPTSVLIGVSAALAAAVVGVGYAASKGAAELKDFTNSALLSGNAVGLSASGFGQLRDSITSIGATKGQAAAVLTEIAASGKIAAGSVGDIAQAAILMERATGQSIADTVKHFEELAKSPYEASVKLNDSFNYLTAAVLKQIKALEDQGKTVEAANLAETTYADALKTRAQTVIDSAGTMERAWHGITSTAKEAWDAMLGIGRTLTPAEKLAEAAAKVAQIQAQIAASGSFDTTAGGAAVGGVRTGQLANLQQQLVLAQQLERQALRRVEIEGEQVTAQQSQNKLAQDQIYINAHAGDYLTKAQREQKALSDARARDQQLMQDGLLTEEQMRTHLYNLRLQYQQQGGNDEIARMNALAKDADQQIELLKAKMASGNLTLPTQLTDAQKSLNAIEEKLKTTLDATTRSHLLQAEAAARNAVAHQTSLETYKKVEQEWEKGLHLLDAQTAAQSDLASAYRQQAVEQTAVAATFGKSEIAIKQALLEQTNLDIQTRESTDSTIPQYLAALYSKKAALEELIPAMQAVVQKQEVLNLMHLSAANSNETQLLQTELSLIGQTADVRNRILTQKRIELDYDQRIADLQLKGLSADALAADTAKLQAEKQIALNNATTRDIVDQWQRAADDINASLTNAISDWVMSGKSLGKSLADALKKEFNNLVLRPIIQAAFSATGIPQMLGTATSGLSGGLSSGMSLANLASSGSSLYTVGSQVLGGSMSAANAAGTIAANATGTGIDGLLLTNGAYGTAASGSAAAAGGTAAGMAGAAGLAGIIALGAYIDYKIDKKAGLPGWAPLIAPGLGVAAMLLGIQAPGGPKGGAYVGAATANPRGVGVGSETQTADQIAIVSGAVAGLTSNYQALLANLGGSGSAAFGLGYETDPRGTSPSAVETTVRGANGQVLYTQANNSVGRDDAALKAEIQVQSDRAVLAALQASSLPQNIQQYLAKLDPITANADAIEHALSVSQEVGVFDKAISQLGSGFSVLSGASVDAQESLIQMAGGVQNLTGSLAGFYQNYYTADEQRTVAQKNIISTLQASGADFSVADMQAGGRFSTRDNFRSAVDYEANLAATGNTDAQKQLLALLSVQQAFADITPAADAASQAVGGVSQSLQEAIDAIRNPVRTVQDIAQGLVKLYDQSDSLNVQLATAQGDTGRAQAIQRAIDTKGMTEAEVAIFDYNKGLQDQIQSLNAAAQAQAQYQQVTDGLTQQTKTLQVQLLQAQGDSTGAAALQRSLDTKGMDAAQIAIYDYNTALHDQIDAANAATQAQQQAAAAAAQLQQQYEQVTAGLNQQSQTLQVQLLQAQGDTAGATALQRSIDTKGMDAAQIAIYDYNQGLKDQITAAQDATAAAQQASQAAAQVAQQYAQITASLNQQTQALQVQLLQAQGNTSGANALQRTIDTAGMDAAQVAIYDYNQTLKDQISAAQAATQAAQQAAQAEQQLAAQRASLQQQLYQAQGNTQAIRDLQLAALDPSLQELQKQIWAVQDASAAAAAAAQADAAAQQHAAQVESERNGLLQQLYQLQGNTAALRALQLQALDPANRALQQHIWALQDQATAAQKAADAAAQLKSAWQSITDSIFGEVERIRGLTGSSPQSLAQAQAQFAIETAKARAGDQDAAKLLPSLSQNLLTLAQSNVASSLDLRLLQARTAGSLQQTGLSLSSQFGLTTPSWVQQGAAMVTQLASLREEQRAQAVASTRLQTTMSNLMQRWELDGLPAARTA